MSRRFKLAMVLRRRKRVPGKQERLIQNHVTRQVDILSRKGFKIDPKSVEMIERQSDRDLTRKFAVCFTMKDW